MTVLCFADTRFPIERANGVQTMATCHALAARGHAVTLVVRADPQHAGRDPFEFYDLPRLDNLRIQMVPASRGQRARRIRFVLTALSIAAANRNGVIYTRDLGLAAFLLQLPRSRRSPVIYESHGVSTEVAAEMPRLLGKPELTPSRGKLRRLDRRERRVWRHARAYVAITRALAEELMSRYGPRDRVFVVPDGARPTGSDPGSKGSDPAIANQGQTPSTQGQTPSTPSTPLAGYAGHLYPWKGVDVFVRALARAPAIGGLIVGGHPGEADRARVDALVRELGLEGRVTITGLVPPRDVRRHLSRATMLVLPNGRSVISERYTSPLKLFEYLTLGRPIIASDLPAIREVLTDGRTALLVPPDDPAALAGALERLAGDAARSAALGRAAAELAPEYTWDKRAERLEAALRAASS